MLAAQRAQELLAEDWGVAADLWSATSWNELHRDGIGCEQHNLLHPDEPAQVPVRHAARWPPGVPIVAVSDFQRAVPDLISRWVPGAVELARHRRLRPLRHPRRAAPLVPGGRALDRHRGARAAGPHRPDRGRDRQGSHRPLRLRQRTRRHGAGHRGRRGAGQRLIPAHIGNAPVLTLAGQNRSAAQVAV